MVRSLKERYEDKRLQVLQERAKRADQQLMLEQRTAQLIVEAMSDDDLDKVGEIVQKLSSIKNPQMPKLTAAIEKAEAELNKYTAGGPLTKAWAKMKNLAGFDNPVVKVTTFADALEKGFSQLPQILKNNGVDLKNADLNKSLATTLAKRRLGDQAGMNKGDRADDSALGSNTKPADSNNDKYEPAVKSPTIGSKSDAEFSKTSYSGKQVPDEDKYDVPKAAEGVQNEADGKPIEGKLKTIVAQLRKALSPGGIFGTFKKVPYIDSQELAQELVNVPLKVFSQVVKKIQGGVKAAEIAPDLKAQVNQAGDGQTQGTIPPEPEKGTSGTQPSQPGKDTTTTTGTTATGGNTSKPQGGGASNNYAKAKQKLRALHASLKGKPNQYDILAKKLVDAGFNPDNLT